MALVISPLFKRIALALAILLFVFSAGLFYVNKILLPIQAKGMIIEAATKALQRKVDFATLQYDPLRGFVITDLLVVQKNDPTQNFIRAKSVSAQIIFPALLKKKVIIPSVRIDAPEIWITRTGKDLWDFSDLLSAPAAAQGKPPMDVIVGGFVINNGQLIVSDTSLGDVFHATIGMPLIKGSLALNGSFDITGKLTTPGTLSFNAHVGLQDNTGKLAFKSDRIMLTPYLRFLPVALPVTIRNLAIADADMTAAMDKKGLSLTGRINLPGLKVSLTDDTKAEGDISLSNTLVTLQGENIHAAADMTMNNVVIDVQTTSIRANITAPATNITMNAGRLEAALNAALNDLSVKAGEITLWGGSKLKMNLVMDLSADTPPTYTGAIETAGLDIKGVPVIDTISAIQGKVLLGPDHAVTDNVTFTALGTPVHVSGKITRFAAPEIDGTATVSKADLALIEKFIPQIIKDNGLTIKGTADINASFAGTLADIPAARINATAILTDASVESKPLDQKLSSLNGTVAYTPMEIAWKDLSANYQGKLWSSNGSMKDPAGNPQISASVKTTDLNAEISAVKKGDKIELIALSGLYFDIPYAVAGNILLAAGKAPAIDMSGEFKVTLATLGKVLPPEQAKQLEPLKLEGVLAIKADVKGAPQNWQDLASTISVQAPSVRMMGYQLTDLAVNARQQNGRLDPVTLSGKLYGGTLAADTTVNLKDKGFSFTTSAKLDNTSLELLKKDTPLKQQQLSGLVAATADLKGTVMDIRKMEGTASFKITQGYLWELEILSKVLGILSASFKGGDVTITDADADLKIAGGKVMTDNLALHSASVTLVGEGWIDFDQNIDLNISPRVEPKTAEGALNPLSQANLTEGLINIRVYNTLTAPKFKQNISAPQIIKKTLQNTVGSILKLFE